jgi:putative transposase
LLDEDVGMPRTARASAGGIWYHALNRGNRRETVFHQPADYDAFVQAMIDARERLPLDILGYCLMPNHFHLVLRPRSDGDLGRWMQWLLTAHVRRYHRYHGTTIHVWQGRFKTFPVQDDEHLVTVLRYVERNALSAALVARAEDWKWSSLPGWLTRDSLLYRDKPPVPPCRVDAPLGDNAWTTATAVRLGLEFPLRPNGRPRKDGV